MNSLSNDEGSQLNLLMKILQLVQPKAELEDGFVWWQSRSGLSVKSIYLRLSKTCNAWKNLEEGLMCVLDKLWKTKVPSKVLLFGWRLLLNKLPTRIDLGRRGTLLGVTTWYVACVSMQKKIWNTCFFLARKSSRVERGLSLASSRCGWATMFEASNEI